MASTSVVFYTLSLFGVFLNSPTLARASLLEDGEDFSNNLVSDLAPLLALFGERVTTQFMSQSTGWADCIALAMAPVGIITIIVSAIRVAGPRWLKAVIGRARENVVAAELEVMSSTSSEVCELWNGQTRAVIRCPGAADICEFICIYPTSLMKKKPEERIATVRRVLIMDIQQAKLKPTSEVKSDGTHDSNRRDEESNPASNQINSGSANVNGADTNASHFDYLHVRNSNGNRASLLKFVHWSKISQAVRSWIRAIFNRRARDETHSGVYESFPPVTPESSNQGLGDDQIVIVRNPKHRAPNMSLNCSEDGKSWQIWACATIGIVIQLGVLVFFGFLTEYRTLRLDKDGSPVEDYAMPTAVIGTLVLALGILICAHVVDDSSTEEVYAVTKKDSMAVAMVWLQKQKTVSEQHFESAAIFPTVKRQQVCTSRRSIDSHGNAIDSDQNVIDGDKKQDNQASGRSGNASRSTSSTDSDTSATTKATSHSSGWQLKAMTTAGAGISLIGIFGQFVGLRGMHWLATMVQLGAIIIMTILRAMIRRHIASGLEHEPLKDSTGFELEWFVANLINHDTAPWFAKISEKGSNLEKAKEGLKDFKETWKKVKEAYLRRDDQKKGDPTAGNCTMETGTSDPRNLTPGTSGSSQVRNTGEHEESQTKLQQSTWAIQTGIDGSLKVLNQQTTNERERSQSNQKFREVSDLSKAQSILDLRRHLGELGKWQGPALEQAFALARAIEKTMAFFMSHSGKTFNDGECLTWTLGIKNAWRHVYGSENGNNDVNNGVIEDIVVTLRYSLKEGWTAPVDELDAALSLWLYSVKDDHLEKDQDASFPSGKDHWIRGVQIPQQKCLHILGPSTDLLLRDLQWWMPNGLDGVLAAEWQPTPGPTQESGQNADSLKQVRVERIGRSGERWPMPNTRQTTSTTNAGEALSNEGQSGWSRLPSCESGCLRSWICRAAVDVRTENDKRRQEQESSEKESSEKELPEKEPPRSCCHLVVESQESLESLYVKDLFSTFVWSLMGYLGQSIISEKLKANVQPSIATGPEAWKDFSLGSQDLSRLVQNLAELGLWTEREAWLSLIPPLSATDNLPGLEAVIELAQKNAAVAERALAWTQAGETYRWLFDEAAASSPTAHIYVKSTAILMRFQTRMKASPPKKFGTFREITYNYRGSGLKEEMAKTEEKLNTQKSQNDSIQLNLNEFFDFHQRLDKNKVSSVRNLEFITFGDSTWRTEQVPYGTLQSVGDIFDRTELHHTMQSNVIDWQTKFSRLGTSEFSDLLKHGSMLHGGRLYQTRAVHDRSVLDELQKYISEHETFFKNISNTKQNRMRWSPNLSLAVLSPSKTCRSLLGSGADPNARDLDHWTPLHYACRFITPEDTLYTNEESDEYARRPLGRRAKMEAKMEAEMEAKERVETLIRHKADVNAQGLDGSTPLHCAAMSDSLKIARLLVDKGANMAVADFEGRTPLHLAAMNKTTCLSCAQGLQRGMSTPLMTYLLDSGSDIDALDEIGWTPLHFAAVSGDTKSIEELMGRGANPNAEDRNGSTPIYLAASCKFGTALDTILDQCTVEGSPYKPDWYLATEKAITCDEVETVRLLMSKMEKKSWPPTKHWKTPFHVAATCKNSEIFIEMIKKAKEREFAPEGILNQTASGDTAFHAAMVARNVEFMQKVIAGVANPPASITNHERELLEQLLKMTDIDGKNVLHWSAGRWFSDSEMTRVIIEAMKAAGLDKTLKSMLEQRDRDGKTPSESVAEWLQGESGLLDQELDRLKEEE